MEKFDLLIIGGGPAGYPAAISCARKGLKVGLIEEQELGGVCLNRGCIPTKALVHAARQVQPVSTSGINSRPSFSWEQVLRSIKNEVVLRLRMGVSSLIKASGVQLIPATGVFHDQESVEVNGQVLKTSNIILATGASPYLPAAFLSDKRVLTSDGLWTMERLPESVAVIGGGVIGCELASVFSAFGVRVTIYEMLPHLLPGQDSEIVSLLEKSFQQRGIRICTGRRIENSTELEEECLLVTIGRKPNLSSFQEKGLAVQEGGLKVDRCLRTNLPHVYAAGDVNGLYQYAYVATREGLVAAANICGKKTEIDYQALPVSIFTEPEIGCCGLTEEEATARGLKIRIGRFPFQALGRAHAEGKTTGLAKVVAEAETMKILGVHVIGERATELVAAATLMVKFGLKLTDIEQTFFCHPTFAEAIMEAVADAAGRCLHLPLRKNVSSSSD